MTDYSEKFEKMRIAGKLAAETLDMLTENIKPGVTTEFIDKLPAESRKSPQQGSASHPRLPSPRSPS